MPTREDLSSLQSGLNAASKSLEDRSGGGSEHSEGRDNLEAARRITDEIEERLSIASNHTRSSEGTVQSVPGQARAPSKDGLPRIPPKEVPANETSGSGSQSGSRSGTGTNSSVSLKQRLAATLQSDQTSMGIASSGSSGPASVVDSNIINSLSDMQGDVFERMILDMQEKHGQEVAQLQSQLASSEGEVQTLNEYMVNLQSHMRAKVAQQDIIKKTNARAVEAQDERDDLKDTIAGMEARQEAHVARLLNDIYARKETKEDTKEEKDTKEEIQEAKDVVEKGIEADAKQTADLEAQNGVIKRLDAQKSLNDDVNRREISYLKGRLNALDREIIRREQNDEAAAINDPELSSVDWLARHQIIDDLLGDSSSANKKIHAELADIRLEMFNMRLGHEKGLLVQPKEPSRENMSHQTLPRPKQEGSSLGLGRHLKGPRSSLPSKRPGQGSFSTLAIIEEENDDDNVSVSHSAVSGQVSSDGLGIADLQDFEEADQRTRDAEALQSRIALLTAELMEVDESKRKLQDDIIDKEAFNSSKLNRVVTKMHETQIEASSMEDKFTELKLASVDVALKNEKEVAQMQDNVNRAEASRHSEQEAHEEAISSEMQQQTDIIHGVQQQLKYALEMQKEESSKLKNEKLILANLELQNARTIAEMSERLQRLEREKDKELHQQMGEEFLDRLQNAEQESNMLQNDLGWKEVHWKTLLENEQQQHEVDRAKLRKLQQALREQKKKTLETQAALKEAEKKCLATQTARTVKAQTPPPSKPKGGVCSRRSRAAGGAARLPGVNLNMPSPQQVCWQTINSISCTVALLCSATSLDILDATKSAYVVWGSATIHSSSLLALLSEQRMAAWLQKRLETLVQPSGGGGRFLMQQLPCVAFRDQTGVSFDASFACASFPAEPNQMKPCSMLVIVEALEDPSWTRSGHRGSHSEVSSESGGTGSIDRSRRRQKQGNASSNSQVSDDITAQDSISQVIANMNY